VCFTGKSGRSPADLVLNKCKRAREEIKRVAVEVARLRSWMESEEAIYAKKMEELPSSSPALASELAAQLAELRKAHFWIRKDLDKIKDLPGYRPGFEWIPSSTCTTIGKEGTYEAEADGGENEDELDEIHDAAREELDNIAEGFVHLDRLG
jgi:hypothetical protein